MAILLDSDRVRIRSELAKKLSSIRDSLNVTKPELKAAVDAIDLYLSDNEVAINNTLPAAAKANLTKKQKALLVSYVTLYRYEVDI